MGMVIICSVDSLCSTSIYTPSRSHLLGLDSGVLLRDCQLDVAGRGHVGVDATVRPVGAAALPHGLVDLDMSDDQVVDVKALDLQGRRP